MPTYDYECSECGHLEEMYQKFSEEEINTCPECSAKTYGRVTLQPPLGFVKGEAITVRQLADRNTKKMGHYELEDRRKADNMETHRKNKEANASRNKINKMTAKQKRNYLENGD
jgi:putative FmdB family regulatory protein